MALLGRLFENLASRDAAHWCARGAKLFRAERWTEAAAAFERALAVDADCAAAHSGLGMARMRLGDRGGALAPLLRAANADRGNRGLALLVGELLLKDGQPEQAHARLAPLASDGADPLAGYLLSLALRDMGALDEATRHLEQLAARHPQHAPSLEALATLHRDAGHVDEALARYRQIEALRPDHPRAKSTVLFHQQYRDHDRAALYRAHLAWGQRFAPARPAPRLPNVPDPERTLTIGYVSADFNQSSAAPFIEPLLSARDRRAFRAVCYSASSRSDAVTEALRRHADAWRDIDGLSDEEAAAQVRDDGVDILVDLNGHTRGGRLGVFALRPAPVQATYLGYGATTGVPAIDYRITDRWLDPPGTSEQYYCEQLVRLSRSMWCFSPPMHAPDPGPQPAAGNGFVTFASLNNFSKVTPQALALWARLLAALPGSRLSLAGIPEGEPRRRVAAVFAEAGAPASRLAFRPRETYGDFLSHLRHVDIALDTFPYTGGATTCDALWMGVPTLTLAGEAVLARSGLSLLSAVGLGDWVASDEEDYLAKAIARARDPGALAALRSGLRARVLSSPLCDVAGFAAEIDAQFRRMWRQWCSRTA